MRRVEFLREGAVLEEALDLFERKVEDLQRPRFLVATDLDENGPP